MKRPIHRLHVLTIAALFAVSCATGSQIRSPQANVAKYAGDLMASVGVVQKFVIDAKITPEVRGPMQITFVRLGEAGQKLSGLLATYDALTDIALKVVKSKEIGTHLEEINSLLMTLLTPITTEDTRVQVSKMLASSFNLLLTIKGALLSINAPMVLNFSQQEALCLT